MDTIIEDDEGEYEEIEDSEDERNHPKEQNDLLNSLNFGLSTEAVQMEKDGTYMDGSSQHIDRPKTLEDRMQESIVQPEQFKVTQKMAEQGRKVVAEKLANETQAEKEQILAKIFKYYLYFPKLKENSFKKNLSVKDDIKKLRDELIRCARELSQQNSLETIQHLDIFFKYFLEILLVRVFKIPAQTLTVEAKESQMIFDQELKEFSIKYGDRLATGPELRYLLKTIQMVTMVVNRNKAMGFFGGLDQGQGIGANVLDPAKAQELHNKYSNII